MNNILRQQSVYEKAIEMFCNINPDTRRKENGFGGVTVSQGYLMVVVALALNQKNYTFIVNETGSGQPRADERRLNINDLFVGTGAQLFVKAEDSAKPGSAILQTYANATAIAPEASYITQADIDAIWNSDLSIQVGDRVYNKALDLGPCRVVGTTAQSSSSTRSERHPYEGMIELAPTVTFDGKANNQVNLNLKYAGLIQASTVGAGLTVYAALKLSGYLVTGYTGTR